MIIGLLSVPFYQKRFNTVFHCALLLFFGGFKCGVWLFFLLLFLDINIENM